MAFGRRTRVFTAALISITVVSVVLQLLGGEPPLAGAFSLSEYRGLVPVQEIVRPYVSQLSRRWNFIEIDYSGTRVAEVNEVYSRRFLFNYDYPNYHFIICNGRIGGDGQILITEKWQRQILHTSARSGDTGDNTIRICVMVDSQTAQPTDFQVMRTEALVEELSNGFEIEAAFIYYPTQWRQR